MASNKNFADIEKASDRSTELLREAWPDANKRREYFRAYRHTLVIIQMKYIKNISRK
ncbi:MAG: hypothetical protein PVF17_02350 [Ignavibacteria bacterium]